MPRKSWWESPFWKGMGAVAALVTIIGFLLQIVGKVDVYNLLIVPIINFFTYPIPLYSIPLAFLVVIGLIVLWANLSNKSVPTPEFNPLARAEFLDNKLAREVAILCKNPRTTDFLRQKHNEIWTRLGTREIPFEDCLKNLEDRGLLTFENGNWKVTKKALAYIAKYHGD